VQTFQEQMQAYVYASYLDNRHFFRLSKNQTADVYRIIDFSFGDIKDKKKMTIGKNYIDSSLLVELYGKFWREKYLNNRKFFASYKKRSLISDSFFLTLPFIKNDTAYNSETKNKIEQVVFLADIFAQKKIIFSPVIMPAHRINSALTYSRYNDLRKVLTKDYKVSAGKVNFYSRPHTSDILQIDTEQHDYLVVVFKN
jgi:hypothetical protein